MPTFFDYNTFRRYVGDFDKEQVDDSVIDTYLDDATIEATSVHITPDIPVINTFDALPQRFRPEVIILGAINWWWNKAGSYADRLTTTIGQASEQATDRYQHALQMIESLQQLYDQTKVLGQEPDMGNLSRWDRNTLTRVGGTEEEDAKRAIIPWLP